MDKEKPAVSVIKLAPVLVERLWGGTWLKEEFGYKTDSDHIGESWIISAHPSGDCQILTVLIKGRLSASYIITGVIYLLIKQVISFLC